MPVPLCCNPLYLLLDILVVINKSGEQILPRTVGEGPDVEQTTEHGTNALPCTFQTEHKERFGC